MRLIEGIVEEVGGAELDEVREENRELRAQLSAARREAESAKRDAAHALGGLRKVLSPLYRALQQVFGELDAAGVEDGESTPPPQVSNREAAIWSSWKAKFRGQAAQLIDVLLLHGELTQQQIAIHLGIHRKNVPQLIFKLNKNSLIQRNGDRYSLKKV